MTELKVLIESIKQNFENIDAEKAYLESSADLAKECREILALASDVMTLMPRMANETGADWQARRERKMMEMALAVVPTLQERVDRYHAYAETIAMLRDRYADAERALKELKGWYNRAIAEKATQEAK